MTKLSNGGLPRMCPHVYTERYKQYQIDKRCDNGSEKVWEESEREATGVGPE